jgi:predicted enzyme related to lactoylglutathione lyase
MVVFYSQPFNIQIHKVDMRGIQSQSEDIGPITLKFVPIRESADLENFPIHQLGFNVPDVKTDSQIANQLGGRVEGDLRKQGTRLRAAIRDPDGNTIEPYSDGRAPGS